MTLIPDEFGYCTVSSNYGCHREGKYGLLPPIMSGRIKSKTSIRYGKVEIIAKLPRGDWIWPGRTVTGVSQSVGMWLQLQDMLYCSVLDVAERQQLRWVASIRRDRHHGVKRKQKLRSSRCSVHGQHSSLGIGLESEPVQHDIGQRESAYQHTSRWLP